MVSTLNSSCLTAGKHLAVDTFPYIASKDPSLPSNWLQSNFICIPLFTQQSVTVYLMAFHRAKHCKPQVNLQHIQTSHPPPLWFS